MTDKKASPHKQSSQKSSSKGLGRGLSSLLGDSAVLASVKEHDEGSAAGKASLPAETIRVDIAKITPGPWQPRQVFDEAGLDDLAASIAQHGILQPLLVRPDPASDGHFQLIAGERRWRAAQKARVHEVPVVIREANDQDASELALIENIQRRDLSAIEEAEGYRQLMDQFGYTQEKLAKVLGKSRSHLANILRLTGLPPSVQSMIRDGRLTPGQIRPLIGHPRAESLAREVEKKGLSARQVEALARRESGPPRRKLPKSADIRALEKQVSDKTGLAIDIRFNEKNQKGVIRISCESLDQLEAMIAKLS